MEFRGHMFGGNIYDIKKKRMKKSEKNKKKPHAHTATLKQNNVRPDVRLKGWELGGDAAFLAYKHLNQARCTGDSWVATEHLYLFFLQLFSDQRTRLFIAALCVALCQMEGEWRTTPFLPHGCS